MKIDDLQVFAGQGIRIVSSGKVSPDSRAGSDKGLVAGQLLQAQVLETTDDGKVLLAIQGRQLLAEAEIRLLRPGDVLWLEVKETEPVPVLMPAAQKGAISELARLLLVNNSLVGDAIKEATSPAAPGPTDSHVSGPWAAIVSLLNETAIKDDAGPIKLLRAITAGLRPGSDIQGLGQRVLAQLTTNTPTIPAQTGESIRSGVLRFADLVQAMGSLNMHNAFDPSSSFYIFPCWFGNGAGWGEWFFSGGKGEKDQGPQSGKGYTLTFYLNMSRIGPVHLAVKVAGTALEGSFFLADQEAVGYVLQYLPGLCAAMKKFGFAPIDFSCRIALGPLLPHLVESLKQQGGLDNFQLLDITA